MQLTLKQVIIFDHRRGKLLIQKFCKMHLNTSTDMTEVYKYYGYDYYKYLCMRRHLQTEARGCDYLCLWLDCDKAGENIWLDVYPSIHLFIYPSSNLFIYLFIYPSI